jgi:hypothetical protein
MSTWRKAAGQSIRPLSFEELIRGDYSCITDSVAEGAANKYVNAVRLGQRVRALTEELSDVLGAASYVIDFFCMKVERIRSSRAFVRTLDHSTVTLAYDTELYLQELIAVSQLNRARVELGPWLREPALTETGCHLRSEEPTAGERGVRQLSPDEIALVSSQLASDLVGEDCCSDEEGDIDVDIEDDADDEDVYVTEIEDATLFYSDDEDGTNEDANSTKRPFESGSHGERDS